MKGGLHEQIKADQAFVPASRALANTLYNDSAIGDAVGIDCKGYDELLVVINCGTIGATTLTFDVGFADIDDAEDASFGILSGTTKVIADTDDNKEFTVRIRAKDNKRYAFVKAVQAGAVACIYNVSTVLGDADIEPVSQTQTAVVPADV